MMNTMEMISRIAFILVGHSSPSGYDFAFITSRESSRQSFTQILAPKFRRVICRDDFWFPKNVATKVAALFGSRKMDNFGFWLSSVE